MFKLPKYSISANIVKLIFLSLAVFAGETSLASDSLDNSVPQARIRMYGQNGKPTNMKYSFNGHTVKKSTGGSAGGAFASMLGMAKSSSIGIPATKTLEIMRQHNRALSKLYYQEFTIPADVPVIFSNAVIGLANVNNTHGNGKTVTYQPSCNGNKLTFVAQAGKDYEVIASSTSAQCGVTIQEVLPDGRVVPLTAN